MSHHAENAKDFEDNLLPVLPNVCNMLSLGVGSEQDRIKIEKLATVLSRITDSFTAIVNPVDNFEQVGILFDQLSNANVHESIVENLRTYSNYVAATTKPDVSDSQEMMQISSTNARTFTEQTISSFLRILKFSCQYT